MTLELFQSDSLVNLQEKRHGGQVLCISTLTCMNGSVERVMSFWTWQISEIRWNQLIFRWRINLWSLPEIFPKFYRLSHRVRQDQKIWGWNWFFKIWIFLKGDTKWALNMFIGEDNNIYICKYFGHYSLISKVQFSIFWTLPAFFEIFHLLLFQAFLVNS